MRGYIVTDLGRCLGCRACEIACMQENHSPPGSKIVEVVQLGPTEIKGVFRMDYIPIMNGSCSLCHSRPEGPSCVEVCPTDAMTLCDEAEALQLLYREGRHQISRFPREGRR